MSSRQQAPERQVPAAARSPRHATVTTRAEQTVTTWQRRGEWLSDFSSALHHLGTMDGHPNFPMQLRGVYEDDVIRGARCSRQLSLLLRACESAYPPFHDFPTSCACIRRDCRADEAARWSREEPRPRVTIGVTLRSQLFHRTKSRRRCIRSIRWRFRFPPSECVRMARGETGRARSISLSA